MLFYFLLNYISISYLFDEFYQVLKPLRNQQIILCDQEKVLAIRNAGFLAMNKKRLDISKKKADGSKRKAVRPKQFYQDTAIDLNLNL
jgi:hypothetical protein